MRMAVLEGLAPNRRPHRAGGDVRRHVQRHGGKRSRREKGGRGLMNCQGQSIHALGARLPRSRLPWLAAPLPIKISLLAF